MNKWRYTIWSAFPDFKDWEDDLRAENPEMTDSELVTLMYDINSGYLEEERETLNIDLPNDIIVIADLGLWNGRVNAYKMIPGNVRECLKSDNEPEWYIDERGDLCCDDDHHDGTNHYIYRLIKKDATERQINNLKQKILIGEVTRRDITRVTTRLGDVINSVYAWKSVLWHERHKSKMVRSNVPTSNPEIQKEFKMA